jgi:hypothetical protein
VEQGRAWRQRRWNWNRITSMFLTAIDISESDSVGDRILALFEEYGCLSKLGRPAKIPILSKPSRLKPWGVWDEHPRQGERTWSRQDSGPATPGRGRVHPLGPSPTCGPF